MVKKTDFKKLVLGNAGKKRVKSGNWSLFGSYSGHVQKGTKGDRTLKGSGSYIVQWAEYQRGRRGGQIEARKEKRFSTESAANRFLSVKRKSPKFIYGSVYDR